MADTVTAIRDALIDHCAMDKRHVSREINPESPSPFLDAVNRAASQAEDVLLFYYIGHGLANLAGELFLATAATTGREVMLPAEALSFAAVRGVLSASRARHVVVVLDCCFSGRAPGVFGAAAVDAFELTNVQGSYLLSATSANELALAPEGELHTAFSGALLEFLRGGDPAALRGLTLDDAYRYLARVLPLRGAPAPQRRLGGDAGRLVVAVNPQAPAIARHRPDRPESSALPRPCPYPGLDSFTADDAEYFCGREQLTDEILSILVSGEQNGPLAIVGRSGAGKSSLLKAGLLPAIKAGHLDIPGSRYWPQLVMTPGEHPMRALARRLAAGTGRDEASVVAALADDPGELPRIAAASRQGHPPSGLIVCVDQFEELFTACADEAERHAFIQALYAASASAGTPPVHVILGLRADFYGRCLDYPELAAMVTAGQVPVRPMSRDELRSAIEDPAAAAGLQLDEGLADRLLLDLESAGGPGHDADVALPLLAFALQATWQQSDKQVLNLGDYQATGGIWGAVTQRAEAVYKDLGEAGYAARLLLLSMVQLGEGTDDVRRRVSVEDLLAARPADEAPIRSALGAYVAARLVTVDQGTAEIAHEALLRAWPRFRQWIKEDRKELLDRQRLADAARLWNSGNGALYTGARLEDARKWLDEEQDQQRRSLSPLERDFVRASARATRRRRNRRLSFITAAVVAALVLATSGVYAVQQRAGNQSSQAVESSVTLAQEADSLRIGDPAGALWLSLAAYNSSKTSQARTELYKSLTTPYPLTLPGGGKGVVDSVAYSPDGTTAAAAWQSGMVLVWRVSDPLHPVLLATLHVRAGGINGLAFSPDGTILAVHALGSLELWKLGTGQNRPALLSGASVAEVVPHPKGVPPWLPVAFSPDGRVVATGAGDGRFRIWNVSSPVRPALTATVTVSSRPLTTLAFSSRGDVLAVASANSNSTGQGGQVGLWDVRDPAKPVLSSALAVTSALAIAFSPVGHLLVAVGGNDDVYVWNIGDLKSPVSIQVNNNDSNGVALYSVAFHPDSEVFVTAGSNGKAETWTESPGEGFTNAGGGYLPDSANPNSVAFSLSGEQILTGDFGGSVKLWITLTPLLQGTLNIGSGGTPYNANGTVVLTESQTGSFSTDHMELWDVSDPLHPERDATLPGTWNTGAFLPGSNTLVTFTKGNTVLRLWNAANPRHPEAGAALPDNATSTYTPATWDANDNGLLLVAGPGYVRLWDVRNTSRPVIESTIRVNPNGETFLTDQFVAVNIKSSPASSELKLWDITNPRRPVAAGAVPNGNPESAVLYNSSQHLLTAADVRTSTNTTLWSLLHRKPTGSAKSFVMPVS